MGARWRSVIPRARVPFDHDSGMEPTLSLVEAASRTGRSRAALQRMASGGQIPGARKVGRGWRLPISGLIAAGEVVSETPVNTPNMEIVELRRELDELRREVETGRARLSTAERLESDLRGQIDDLRAANDDLRETVAFHRRELLARNPVPPAIAEPTPPITSSGSPRRRWWRKSV